MPGKLNKIISFFILILLSGCVTIYNPATQKKEILLIGTPDEVALGNRMDRQLQSDLKIIHDPNLQYRLDYIGRKIARICDRQDVVYYFRLVPDKELNAFSIPGGFVYVNRGLIDIATDDELAGVLAHEIAHIACRNSVKKLQTALGYQIILNIALGIRGSIDMARAMNIIFDLSSLGYGRKDEFFADKLAVKYAKRAGFNPHGLVTFFEKLKQEAKSRGSNFKIVFLSSHPPLEERIKNAEKEIALIP